MLFRILKQPLRYFIIISGIMLSASILIPATGKNVLFLFPIQDYSQRISQWINPNDPDYNKILLSPAEQQGRMQEFYNHYFASDAKGLSPWSANYVSTILQQTPPDDIQSIELSLVSNYSNQNKPVDEIGYGENFRPHAAKWIDNIQNSMNLTQFNPPLNYQEAKRGITVTNLEARILPTDDTHFYSYQLPGQGYPFDNLQMSAIWAGTPVYVIGKSADGSWDLVLTPDIIAWVHSQGIAYTDIFFIEQWQNTASHQLAAIIKNTDPNSRC